MTQTSGELPLEVGTRVGGKGVDISQDDDGTMSHLDDRRKLRESGCPDDREDLDRLARVYAERPPIR